MRASLVLFRPFIAVINGSANAVLRWFGAGASAHRHIHSPDEIELMIAESRDGGLLEPDEQQRLRRALRLGRRSAADLMVPLDRLTMISADEPWERIVQVVASSSYSRLPVYRGGRDQVIGTLRAKDVLDWSVRHSSAAAIDQLLRPVARLRSEVSADRVITILRDRRLHQAVVTTEAE